MSICSMEGVELPEISETGCSDFHRPKTRYKGRAKYLGVKGVTHDGEYIHHFDGKHGLGLIQSFMPVDSIEGLEEGQEIEIEFYA